MIEYSKINCGSQPVKGLSVIATAGGAVYTIVKNCYFKQENKIYIY